MKIYLAGPMRGIPEFNYPAFVEATNDLRELGHEVFSPAERDLAQGFDPSGLKGDDMELECKNFDLREALGADLEYITQHADAVAVLPGWQDSKGAKAEVAAARAIGIHVMDAISLQPLEDAQIYADPALNGQGEVRVTNQLTGGQKGSKPERYDLIPAAPLEWIARLYGKGAAKYAERNWERGYDWNLSFAALQRHVWAWWQGEDIDPDTECPHLASVVFHAFALMEWAVTHPELDNRPGKPDPNQLTLDMFRDVRLAVKDMERAEFKPGGLVTHPIIRGETEPVVGGAGG